MVFDPESATHLKPWLIRTLEPICDAEPGALADYILALLKHPVPENEMRQELAVQLDEFLEKECSSFIETLFTVIRTKSYLPYQAVPPSPSFPDKPLDNGIPIPLDALLTAASASPDRTRKRSSTDDERDGRPPAKGPRLNNGAQFSRYGTNGGDDRMGPHSSGGWTRPPFRDGGMGMGMGMGMVPFGVPMPGMQMNGMPMMNGRRPQGYQPPDQKRGLCRDYHQNGYCARGPMCKYSHADDAVVPGQLYPGNGMQFMPPFPTNGNGMPFMQGAAYDPHESRMDMRPTGGRQHQRAPLLPRIQQEDGSLVHPINASGELPVIQDLTPVLPQEPSANEPQPRNDVDMQQNIPQVHVPPQNLPHMPAGPFPVHNNMNGNGYQPGPGMEIDQQSHMPGMRPPTSGRGQFRGRGGGGGRGRGTFGGDVPSFRPEKRNDKTLVVEKIPEDKLSLESVNGWFKRFGTVTNVAIDANNAKALVSFAQHEEAHTAWKSEDAVFGNRFVKVFWHRPMEGHGQVGARMLAASAPLVANIGGSSEAAPSVAGQSSTPAAALAPSAPTPAATATPKKTAGASTSSMASALAAKSQLLEQTIAEQKRLMAALGTATPEEKKEIMAKFKKLDQDMSKLKDTPAAPVAATAKAAGKKPADGLTDLERKERERLDRELEMHGGEKEETTEDLQAKLQRLKEEAASLGLDSPLPTTSYRGGYRGRARGGPRGYSRGGFMRGGPPRASMKLDNRPKKLLVKGASEENSQALRDWYETTGQLESIESNVNGSYVVAFKSRSAAEMGLAKGSNIPMVGSVQLAWYTGTASHSTSSHAAKSMPSESHSGSGATANGTDYSSTRSPEMHVSHLPEEEVVASGWGGGDDDEDGMGLL